MTDKQVLNAIESTKAGATIVAVAFFFLTVATYAPAGL